MHFMCSYMIINISVDNVVFNVVVIPSNFVYVVYRIQILCV